VIAAVAAAELCVVVAAGVVGKDNSGAGAGAFVVVVDAGDN